MADSPCSVSLAPISSARDLKTGYVRVYIIKQYMHFHFLPVFASFCLGMRNRLQDEKKSAGGKLSCPPLENALSGEFLIFALHYWKLF